MSGSMRAWGFRSMFFASLGLAACGSPSEPGVGVPTELQPVRGDSQTAVVGHSLTERLEVRVLDRRREPVSGVEVTFTVVTGGGSLTPGVAATDLQGTARTRWTLGTALGSQQVRASLPSWNVAPVVFAARATPDAPAELVKVSGDDQTGRVGEALPEPLVVQVRDVHGNGIEGVHVAWNAQGEDAAYGSLTPETDRSDALGFARATWTLGTVPGTQGAVFAAIDCDTVAFGAEAVPGRIANIQLIPATLVLLHPATIQVEAMAVDPYDNRVEPAGAFVWSSSDPTLATVTPDLDYSGRATVATLASGNGFIHASVEGVTGSLPLRAMGVGGSFRVTNTGLSWADALNDLGEVVGTSGLRRLGLWRDGQVIDLGSYDLGGGTTATAVNNTGAILLFQRVTGHTGIFGGGFSGVLRGGVLTPISDGFARAYDLNDQGEAVGSLVENRHPDYWYRGFLWVDGRMTRLAHITVADEGPLGQTHAVAINQRTQVAVNMTPSGGGGSNDPQVSSAYLWQAGEYTPIPRPDPACRGWVAVDLNDAGQVLVNCGVGAPRTAAFLWDGAAFTNLAPIARGSGLNNRGEAVGWGSDGVYLWRNGLATRLLELTVSDLTYAYALRINNLGQVILNYDFANRYWAYLLTP